MNISGSLPNYYYKYDSSVYYEERMYQALDWLDLPKEERYLVNLMKYDSISNSLIRSRGLKPTVQLFSSNKKPEFKGIVRP